MYHIVYGDSLQSGEMKFESFRCTPCSASSSLPELNLILHRRSKTNEQACISWQSWFSIFNHHCFPSPISRQHRLIPGPSKQFASMSHSSSLPNHILMNAYPHCPNFIFRIDSLVSIWQNPARYKSYSI